MRVLGLLLLTLWTSFAYADDQAALWQALRDGGHVALIRHALAPGTFDPPEFSLGDCSTQRNLSAEGKAQARTLGERFRKNGVNNARVYSSEWCRCVDTATAMQLGPVTPLPALNSLHGAQADPSGQTEAVRKLIREHRSGETLVLVTHQVNISRLTGAYAGSGEIVVVRMDGSDLSVVGRIE